MACNAKEPEVSLEGVGHVAALFKEYPNTGSYPLGQTGYSQPIPKAGIGGSPRFAARTPIGIFETVPVC
jgi:hypothetical protein